MNSDTTNPSSSNNTVSSLNPISVATVEQSDITNCSTKGRDSVPKAISTEVNVQSWRGDNMTRYFLSDLLSFQSGKMDKKITIANISDAVVWNVVYLMELKDLPTASPTDELRNQTTLWLIEFRKQILNIVRDKIKQRYLMAANSTEWVGLRQTGTYFTTYGDLLERTKTVKDELVSTVVCQ